jgi:hypothetical protein
MQKYSEIFGVAKVFDGAMGLVHLLFSKAAFVIITNGSKCIKD